MSDYFGALIRSSGLRIGGRAPTVEAPPATPDDLVEITEERVALPIASTPHQDPPRPIRAAVEDPVEIGSRPENAPDPARPVRVESHVSTAGSIDTPSPRPVAPGTPPLVQPLTLAPVESAASAERLDPVRIAMQWVAADPEARAEMSQPPRAGQPARVPPLTPAVAADVVVEQVATVDRDSSPSAGQRSRSTVREPAIRTIATEPSRHWPDERRGRDAVDAMHDRPLRRDEDEIVEISIGAINLHVEAPPQTVVQTPAARPQPPASAPRRERSGLSRRYLRSL